jgi:hypothetical protein
MKILPFAAAALLIAPATIIAQPRAGSQPPPNCPLTVGFASYGAGIDPGSYEAVERLFRRDRAVRAVTRHRWGREGEITLCARTRNARDAGHLFQAVRRLIPSRPRGPVSIATRSGMRYKSPPPSP